MIEATDMVEIAKIQAALPPAPARGYEPCWADVTGVKPFGAFILLPSGESGLLHVSEMHGLNGGRRVEDASLVVNVGQSVYVKVTGKNEKGQLNFALVSEA
jgi:predicted RNA-binding protein with RPS1 domain